jgi:seryl-tRNA synthetase
MPDNDDLPGVALVEEAEEVDVVEAPAQEGNAEILISLENLIKSSITKIDKLQQETRTQKQMIDSVFENDETFKTHLDQAKEATVTKNKTRQEIMKQPSVVALNNKVKTLSAELKELQQSLSDYLLEYQRMAGVNEIEGEDGEVRVIVNSARVVRASSGKKK